MSTHPIIYEQPMKFQKINTLFKRDAIKTVKGKGIIQPGHFSDDAFKTIKSWTVTEKINGKNIRIFMKFPTDYIPTTSLWIGTRNNMMGPDFNEGIYEYIKTKFTQKAIKKVFKPKLEVFKPVPEYVMIFGEGVGPGINEAYGTNSDFIVFDIVIDGWFLEQNAVQNISKKLGLKCVPVIPGIETTEDIIEYVKSQPDSIVANKPYTTEGVVCTSAPLLLTRNGYPVRFKLKTKDFRDLKAISDKEKQ